MLCLENVDAELPVSARFLLFVLEDTDETLTAQALMRRTGLSRATTYRSLDLLRRLGYVEVVTALDDSHCRHYRAVP